MHQQRTDALIPDERRAGPADHCDPDPGQVLGPFQAAGIPLGRGPPRQPETQEDYRAGGRVGRVWIASPSSPTDPGQCRQQQLG
jgi:hypothetical protein